MHTCNLRVSLPQVGLFGNQADPSRLAIPCYAYTIVVIPSSSMDPDYRHAVLPNV